MNAKAAVLASFVADSLALGPHWIYDTDQIKETFGRVKQLLKPGLGSYHAGKETGEFTHYGDQTFVLLQSVAENGHFDLGVFADHWKKLFDGYKGYFDQASKGTLQNFAAGRGAEESGSRSMDLAGASRIAPLVYRYWKDEPELVRACTAQTRMTHNNEVVIVSAQFFARVCREVLGGTRPIAAMQEVARTPFGEVPVAEWVAEGVAAASQDSVQAISLFGQSCHADHAFPGVVQLIARYENDLSGALTECVMAGGDSAARGMLVGMVLGAHLGEAAIPGEWLTGLKKYREIVELLGKLDAAS